MLNWRKMDWTQDSSSILGSSMTKHSRSQELEDMTSCNNIWTYSNISKITWTKTSLTDNISSTSSKLPSKHKKLSIPSTMMENSLTQLDLIHKKSIQLHGLMLRSEPTDAIEDIITKDNQYNFETLPLLTKSDINQREKKCTHSQYFSENY